MSLTNLLLFTLGFLSRFFPLFAVLALDASLAVMIFFYFFETFCLVLVTSFGFARLSKPAPLGAKSLPPFSCLVFTFLVLAQTLFLIGMMAGRDPLMSAYIDAFFLPNSPDFRNFLLALVYILASQILIGVLKWKAAASRIESFLDSRQEILMRLLFGQTLTLLGGLILTHFKLASGFSLIGFTLFVILLQWGVDHLAEKRSAAEASA